MHYLNPPTTVRLSYDLGLFTMLRSMTQNDVNGNDAGTCTCQMASGTDPHSKRDKKEGMDQTPGLLTLERTLARGMTKLIVLLIVESLYDNGPVQVHIHP